MRHEVVFLFQTTIPSVTNVYLLLTPCSYCASKKEVIATKRLNSTGKSKKMITFAT